MMAEKAEEVPRLNVSLAISESAVAKLDPCNVFVKYLPSTLDDAELEKLFGSFGRILSSKIMVDPTSRKSLGFGFVRFSNASEAKSAIESMDGHKMGTKRLLCKLANSSKERLGEGGTAGGNAGGVPVSAGKQSSDDSPKGPRSASSTSVSSSSASAAHAGGGGSSGGYQGRGDRGGMGGGGTSNPSTSPSTTTTTSITSPDHRQQHGNYHHQHNACDQSSTHPHSHQHQPQQPQYHHHGSHTFPGGLRVPRGGGGGDFLSRASTSPANLSPRSNKPSILNLKQPSTNLYIKSLLPSDTEDTLRELFGGYGEIVACKVMVDKMTGQSRRIGFVRYSTIEQATSAIHAMHGTSRGEGTLNVKYADDERQKEMRKRLRQSSGSTTTPGVPSSLPMHMDPTSTASMMSQGHLISQPPLGMLSRHGSLEGRADFARRAATLSSVATPSPGPYLPLPWPYAWPAPVYTSVYETSHAPWLLVYPSDGFVGAPRATETMPQYPYPMPSLYYSVDPNAPDTRPAGEETSLQASPSRSAALPPSKAPEE